MVNPGLLQIDLSKWDQIAPPPPSTYPFSLSANPNGYISLGERLRDEMRKHRPELVFQFHAQPDRRVLALVPCDSGEYHFPKGGRVKDLRFTQSLIAAGVILPARYQVAWNPQTGAWVACLVSSEAASPAAALKASLPPRQKRKSA